jgi:diguanylate cyclase (GGDEF)-like protein
MSDPDRRLSAAPAGGPRDAGRARPGRLASRIGLTAEPPAVRRLVGFAVVAMLAVVVVALEKAMPHGLPDAPYWLPIATAAVAFSQLFSLNVRTGTGSFTVGWGEAALIVCLFGLPEPWLPIVFGVGAFAAHFGRFAAGRWPTITSAVRNAAAVTLGGSAGALIAALIAPTYQAALTPRVAIAASSGAIGYFIITAAFAAASLAGRRASPFWRVFPQILRNKLLMVFGNVAVGLAVVAMIGADPLWVLLLPPFLWLLHQTYAHRLRADEERRTWQAFAGATKALNQLDERSVAVAGVEGAMTLFAPQRAEVRVRGADGRHRRFAAEPGGPVAETIDPAGPDAVVPGAAEPAEPDARETALDLLVKGAAIGELRLAFEASVSLSARQQMAFSAYADALAAALHDAATHRQLQDVTERSFRDAEHDTLTGLPNRATMLARGDEALRGLDRDCPVALLLLDVDHFKDVNDTLGHAAGDDLLRIMATRLADELIDDGEILARLGGDEFALLLTKLPEEKAVTKVTPLTAESARSPLRHSLRRARRLAEALATPTEVAGVQLSVEASVGVVVAPAGSSDMSELLRRADIAMYQAKRGGASVAWYDSAKDAASTDRLALLAELREALAVRDQLQLALQPAVDLITGGPTGVEALIRWRHPRRGLLNPVDFVRAVENSELLGPFTRHVIDLALGHAAEWAAHGLDVPVAVNMSPRSLLDPRLPAEVAELLRRHRVPARRLVLEITETVVMSELEVIDEVLAGLRDLGVQLAVDDFGTGYSSLTFLTRIRVDEVKVDRAFVAKMVDSPEAAAIVRTTVELGKELGLRVVAEGVETDEQKKLLTAMGCGAAQGYHFFKPMPAENIAAVLGKLAATAQARVIRLRADGVS